MIHSTAATFAQGPWLSAPSMKRKRSFFPTLKSWSSSEESVRSPELHGATERRAEKQPQASSSTQATATTTASQASSSPQATATTTATPAPSPYHLDYDYTAELRASIDVDVPRRPMSAGLCLQTVRNAVDRFINATGGPCLCCFVIGITTDLTQRFQAYKAEPFLGGRFRDPEQYLKMTVVFATGNLAAAELMEASLIALYRDSDHKGLRNVNPGGDGGLAWRGRQAPYFTYVTGCHSDANLRPL